MLDQKESKDLSKIKISKIDLKRSSKYTIISNGECIGKRISRVKNLPRNSLELEKNTKYKFKREVFVNKWITPDGKIIFYIDGLFDDKNVVIEIKQNKDFSNSVHDDLLKEFNKDFSSTRRKMYIAFVFVFEHTKFYFLKFLWKNLNYELWTMIKIFCFSQ